MFSCEICEIFKNTFFYRTPLVAAAATKSGVEHDGYLQQFSREGLIKPNIALRDFIFQTFSVIDFISPTIKTITKNVYVRIVSERILLNLGCSTNFTSDLHVECGGRLTTGTVVNIFFNNEQKHTSDLVRKEQVVDFEKKKKE